MSINDPKYQQSRYSHLKTNNVYDEASGNNPEKQTHQLGKAHNIHTSMIVKPEKVKSTNRTGTKTKTQIRSEFPEIHNTSNLVDKNNRNHNRQASNKTDIFNNKNLKYLFREYCKQSYLGGAHATFDQISQSGDKMTLNKWIMFLKQFELIKSHVRQEDKRKSPRHPLLSNKQAVDCFKQATNLHSEMDMKAFLNAVDLVKLKLNLDDEFLMADILQVDTHLATRNRLACLKINFAGPQKNFFIEGRLTEGERKQEKLKQEEFKEKERKRLANMTGRQYIPHQGMSQEHIIRQIGERKKKREERSEKLKNWSHLDPVSYSQSKFKKGYLTQAIRPRSKKKKQLHLSSYSQVYNTNRRTQAEKTNRRQNNMTSLNNNPLLESRARLNYQEIIGNNSRNLELPIITHNSGQVIEERPEQFDKSRIKDWEEELGVNSDAESDQILRDHFKNEKKMKDYFLKASQVIASNQVMTSKQKSETKNRQYLKAKKQESALTPTHRMGQQRQKKINIFSSKPEVKQEKKKQQQKKKVVIEQQKVVEFPIIKTPKNAQQRKIKDEYREQAHEEEDKMTDYDPQSDQENKNNQNNSISKPQKEQSKRQTPASVKVVDKPKHVIQTHTISKPKPEKEKLINKGNKKFLDDE